MYQMTYPTQGVCSRSISILMDEDGTIADVAFEGGCPGNLLGIRKLVKGKSAEEVIDELKGTACGNKPTSCPDQLARALDEMMTQINNLKKTA